MIYTYKLAKEAFEAICQGKKTVEVRLDNDKKVQSGDYISFSAVGEEKTTFNVYVDKVEYYDNIYDLEKHVNESLWSFEPTDVFHELINKEFSNTYGLRVKAIYFHPVKVSIIMPAFNALPYISETLNCLCDQKYKDFELILLDDCSSDHTGECIAAYDAPFPLIYYRNERRSGPAKLRNLGMSFAHGEYITFLDSDDLFEPEFLEQLVQSLDESDADVAIAAYDSFVSDIGYRKYSNCLFYDNFIDRASSCPFSYRDIPEYDKHWINVSWNKLYRREHLLVINAYFQDLPSSNDVFFSHIVVCNSRMIHVRTGAFLAHYRINGKSNISELDNHMSEIEAFRLLLTKFAGSNKPLLDYLYNEFIFGIMKCIRWGSGGKGHKLWEWTRNEILYKHELIPQGYIKQHHPWLFRLLSEYSFDADIFKVNYIHIQNAELKYDKLKQLFLEMACMNAVGVIRISYDLKYLMDIVGLKPNFVEADKIALVKPDTFVCVNPLEISDVNRLIYDKQIQNARIIKLFDL